MAARKVHAPSPPAPSGSHHDNDDPADDVAVLSRIVSTVLIARQKDRRQLAAVRVRKGLAGRQKGAINALTKIALAFLGTDGRPTKTQADFLVHLKGLSTKERSRIDEVIEYPKEPRILICWRSPGGPERTTFMSLCRRLRHRIAGPIQSC